MAKKTIYETDFVRTLASFRQSERVEFLAFLDSPYFTGDVKNIKLLRKLCTHVLEYANHADASKYLTPEQIYKYLYPRAKKEPGFDYDLPSRRSEAMKLVKKFIFQKELEKTVAGASSITASKNSSNVVRTTLLARFYFSKKLIDIAKKYSTNLENWRKESRVSWNYIDHFYALHSTFDGCTLKYLEGKHDEYYGLPNLIQEVDRFSEYFKLDYATILAHHIRNAEHLTPQLKEIIQIDLKDELSSHLDKVKDDIFDKLKKDIEKKKEGPASEKDEKLRKRFSVFSEKIIAFLFHQNGAILGQEENNLKAQLVSFKKNYESWKKNEQQTLYTQLKELLHSIEQYFENLNSKEARQLLKEYKQIDKGLEEIIEEEEQVRHIRIKKIAYSITHPTYIPISIYKHFYDAVSRNQDKLSQNQLLIYRIFLKEFIKANKFAFGKERVQKTFDLQKEEYEDNYPYPPKVIHPSQYFSVFIHAIRCNDLQWLEEIFMKKFKEKLHGPAIFKKNTIAYSAALLHFAKKEYASAEEKLAYVTTIYKNEWLKPLSRVLDLKIKYENVKDHLAQWRNQTYNTIEEERLCKIAIKPYLADVDSTLKQFRRMRTLDREDRRALIDFASILNRFVSINNNNNTATINDIRKDVESNIFITERDWLLSIIPK